MRMESWTILGSPALVILPKVEAPATLDPGELKWGVFSRSKKSPRNWVVMRSVMRIDLANDQSRLKTSGARRRLRGLLPNVPGAASANAEVLNQALMSSERGLSVVRYGLPMRSPRSRLTPESERSCPEVTLTGRPERHVQMPVVCQAPNTARSRCGAWLRAGRL